MVTSDTPPRADSSQALTRGLEILRVVSESRKPVTSTEVARRVGLHQSWASRVLRTLSAAGYVRKPDYHSFTVDYGVLTLGGNSLQHFPLITRTRQAMRELAEEASGLEAVLATLWQGQLLYFHRTQQGREPVPLSVGFPLHLSSVGLRLLLAQPKGQALAALRQSRQRYGWERPTELVPETPEGALQYARSTLRHDCLVFEGYYAPGLLGCAIPIEVPGQPLAALALTGAGGASLQTALLLLQKARRSLENALSEK